WRGRSSRAGSAGRRARARPAPGRTRRSRTAAASTARCARTGSAGTLRARRRAAASPRTELEELLDDQPQQRDALGRVDARRAAHALEQRAGRVRGIDLEAHQPALLVLAVGDERHARVDRAVHEPGVALEAQARAL